MSGVPFASVHAGLGEIDEAMRWFEKAYEDRTPGMVYALLVPRIDPQIADDPRLARIIKGMGFPPAGD